MQLHSFIGRSLAVGFVLIGLISMAPPAHADDGGVMGISVKDLVVNKIATDNKGNQKALPIAKPNYRIDMTGGQAAQLMKILPPTQYVITGMFPKFAPTYNANFKSLEITGNKTQPTVVLDCQGGTLNEPTDGATPSLTPFKDGAHCTITVQPIYSEDDNIDYSFKPTCHN